MLAYSGCFNDNLRLYVDLFCRILLGRISSKNEADMYIEEWFSFWKNDLLFRNERKTNNTILSFKKQWDKLDVTLHFFIIFRNFDKALDEFEPDFILYNAGMTDFNLIFNHSWEIIKFSHLSANTWWVLVEGN